MDVGTVTEIARWVFARSDPAITALTLERTAAPAGRALPAGYRWVDRHEDAVTHRRILDADGLLAASGYAAAVGAAFAYIVS